VQYYGANATGLNARSLPERSAVLIRAAGTALLAFVVGTIAFEIVDGGKSEVLGNDLRIVGERITKNQNLSTEPRYVLGSVREIIEVFCPSPIIQEFRTRLDVQNVLRRDALAGLPGRSLRQFRYLAE
jgi:hypothetical protein